MNFRTNGRGFKHTKNMQRAFTLLEIMLVIVIIIALAAVVVPNLSGQQDKAKIWTTKIQIKGIEDALDLFKADVGRYPTTEEGLQVLNSSEQMQDEDLVKKWHGPYIGKGTKEFTLKDSWEKEFHYTCPGEHNTKSYDLYSTGPDTQEGTEDDIFNWEAEK